MKDYYVILGVLPDAEDVVIKAAYKALVQRYHPDRYKGDPAEAQRKTVELNEAYEILSDTTKRASYDRQRKASQGNTSDYDDNEDNSDDSSFNELDEDWQLALQYYPDLTKLETRLRRISAPLSVGFRQAMLSTKDFNNRQQIAKFLEQRFLENYFGTNPKVIEFALKLIFDGKKAGARELNKTVNVLGEGIEAKRVIDTLTAKHYAEEIAAEQARQKQEQAKKEKERQEQLERERLEQERLEQARLKKERLAAEKWERERPKREAREARERAEREANEKRLVQEKLIKIIGLAIGLAIIAISAHYSEIMFYIFVSIIAIMLIAFIAFWE